MKIYAVTVSGSANYKAETIVPVLADNPIDAITIAKTSDQVHYYIKREIDVKISTQIQEITTLDQAAEFDISYCIPFGTNKNIFVREYLDENFVREYLDENREDNKFLKEQISELQKELKDLKRIMKLC